MPLSTQETKDTGEAPCDEWGATTTFLHAVPTSLPRHAWRPTASLILSFSCRLMRGKPSEQLDRLTIVTTSVLALLQPEL